MTQVVADLSHYLVIPPDRHFCLLTVLLGSGSLRTELPLANAVITPDKVYCGQACPNSLVPNLAPSVPLGWTSNKETFDL